MSRYEDITREAEAAAKAAPSRAKTLLTGNVTPTTSRNSGGVVGAKGEIGDSMLGANTTERAYGELLTRRQADGLILRWWWQPGSFRLATMENGYGDFYRPDFMVQLPDGSIEIHETKGFMRADSQSKLKLFACIYPFALFVAKKAVKRDGGAFTLTRYKGSLP